MLDDEKDVLEFPADDDVDAVSEDEFEEAAEEAVEEEADAEAVEAAADSDDSKKIRELEDRYVRLFAEYDNFRKRTSKERRSSDDS